MIVIATSSMVGAVLLFATVLYRKDMLKSIFFPFLLFAILIYQLGNFIEIASTTLEAASIGVKIRFLGVPFIPTLWYLCIREFCGLKFKNQQTLALLMVVPILISALAFTWEDNHLLFSNISYPGDNHLGNPLLTPGPLFKLRLLYQYGVNAVGLVTLIWQYRKGTTHFQKQILLFLLSTLIPLFNLSTYIVNIEGYNMDITPYGLLFSAFLLTCSLYRVGVINRADILKANAMHHVHEGILLFDRNGIYMDANRAACEIFPQLCQVPLGTSLTEMNYLPFSLNALERSSAKVGSVQEFTKESEGSLRTFGISFAQIEFRRRPIGYGAIFNNISSLKKMLSDLEEKSIRDPLTKLYNRGHLFSIGDNWIENARFNRESFSIVLFDIDHFKLVNDNHGHLFGDYVLREMAQVCSVSLRQSDVLGRYGGEEFCLLLFNTPLEGAYRKAESLRVKVSVHSFEHEGIKTDITASFGVACYDRELGNDNFTAMIKRADENMYRAKEGGRNRVC